MCAESQVSYILGEYDELMGKMEVEEKVKSCNSVSLLITDTLSPLYQQFGYFVLLMHQLTDDTLHTRGRLWRLLTLCFIAQPPDTINGGKCDFGVIISRKYRGARPFLNGGSLLLLSPRSRIFISPSAGSAIRQTCRWHGFSYRIRPMAAVH